MRAEVLDGLLVFVGPGAEQVAKAIGLPPKQIACQNYVAFPSTEFLYHLEWCGVTFDVTDAPRREIYQKLDALFRKQKDKWVREDVVLAECESLPADEVRTCANEIASRRKTRSNTFYWSPFSKEEPR